MQLPKPKPKGRPRKRPLEVERDQPVAQVARISQPKLPNVDLSVADILATPYIHLVPTLFSDMLGKLQALCIQDGVEMNQKVKELGEVVFSKLTFRNALQPLLLEKDIGLHRKNVRLHLCELSTLCIELDRYARLEFDRSVSHSPRTRLCHVFEVDSYDETPMPMRLRELVASSQQAGSSDSSGPVLPTVEFHAEQGPSKLFQVESWWGALHCVELHGASRYFITTHPTQGFIQVMDRVTGETTRQCLRLHWSSNLLVNQYEQRGRAAVSDQGKANPAAERGIRVEDRPDWQHCYFKCHAHLCSGVFNSTFSAFGFLITGMIQIAISLESAG